LSAGRRRAPPVKTGPGASRTHQAGPRKASLGEPIARLPGASRRSAPSLQGATPSLEGARRPGQKPGKQDEPAEGPRAFGARSRRRVSEMQPEPPQKNRAQRERPEAAFSIRVGALRRHARAAAEAA